MSDVLQTAQKYRDRLRADIAKVDDFIRLAEKLITEARPEAGTLACNATDRMQSLESRPAEQQRTSIDATPSVAAETDPAPSTKVLASLFRGPSEPYELERGKIVA